MKLQTPLLVGIIVVLIAALGFFFYQNQQKKVVPQVAGISGTFNINGVIPSGATITLEERDVTKEDPFTAFASSVNPADQSAWSFTNAQTGDSYEIRGTVVFNGKTLFQSSPISISAPATDEIIVFNIPSENPTGAAVLSGTVGLNGYIPQGSTITFQGKAQGETIYTPFTQAIPAKDGAVISYDQALSGMLYETQALLFDGNGNAIGTSNTVTAAAPAMNEVFNINSTATKPPVPTPLPNTPTPTPASAPISGSINFNGASLPNSRIVIFQRVSGKGNFQVAVDNITPSNGTTWQWNGSQSGTWYDMLAVYKQRQNDGTDKDISDSNTITIAAPAANESFTLNSGYSLPAPTAQGSALCQTYNQGSNNWNATVAVPAVANAQSYWVQVGSTNGGYDLLNSTANSTGQTQVNFNVTANNSTTYWIRYAYANVSNQNTWSNQFSAFSNTSSFTCTH